METGDAVASPRAATRQDGKLAFWIDVAHAGKLQQLMMQIIPGVNTPEQMIEWLIDQAGMQIDAD